jgi:hypothetical protein
MSYQVNAYFSAAGLYRMNIEFNNSKRIILSQMKDDNFLLQLYKKESASLFEETEYYATLPSFHKAITQITVILLENNVYLKSVV